MSQYLESDIAEILDGLGGTARAFSGKTVLLTGGAGFLGRYLAAVFSRLGQREGGAPVKLVILDNLITAAETSARAPEGAGQFVQFNVIEPYAHPEPVDFVIHAAGIASPYYYRKYPLETLEVAIWGTKNMLELARAHEAKLLFFSTSEIYGDPDPRYVPTPESYRGNVSSLGPRACYDESKRVGETLCRVYHEYFGVDCKIVRPFNVYGPGMSERDYRVLPNFASRIRGGKPLHVYGSGAQTRTFCYVTDAVAGFLKVLAEGVPGEVYNIGNDRPEVSVVDLAGRIQAVLGRKIDLVRIDYPDAYPPDEPQRRCPDLTKARKHLNFEPRVGLDEGLRRFFGWTEGAYTGA